MLRTPDIAAKFATEQRDRMAAIKQAEVDIRKDEDSRNAAANRALLKDEAKKARNPGVEPAVPDIDSQFSTNESVDLHLAEPDSKSVNQTGKP